MMGKTQSEVVGGQDPIGPGSHCAETECEHVHPLELLLVPLDRAERGVGDCTIN